MTNQPGRAAPVPLPATGARAQQPFPQRRPLLRNRWMQLAAGILAMIAVANFQYSWTLFVEPLQHRHGWSRVAILDALNLFFILAQTWLVPVEGYLADRFGPRPLLVCGGILAALAWVICSTTSSLGVLYAAQVVCGSGSGIVYSVSMGNALKWFPDRRGLAAGLTAAAFGAGSAATVLPVRQTIRHAGYEAAFLWFGLAQGFVVVLAGLVLAFPRPGEVPAPHNPRVPQSRRDFTPTEMLRSPVFWLLYVMMTLGAIPGLLMLGQIAPMARDFGIADQEVVLWGITLAALEFALMLDRVMGGLTRPVFGWFSDHVGREPAMFLAFALEGTALLVLIQFPHEPVLFVLTSGLAFFGWGAVFSLLPAACSDLFGRTFATTNYGLLYTAKGLAAILLSGLNRMQAETGSWVGVFALMIAFDWLAALLALFVLRPLRRRWVQES
jgi:OFA family oxalate/formate antiporter-like MFS transporter